MTYAEKPWAYPMLKPRKKAGRPKIWGTQDEIDFCLYHCPFPDGECKNDISTCEAYARFRTPQKPQAKTKPRSVGNAPTLAVRWR